MKTECTLHVWAYRDIHGITAYWTSLIEHEPKAWTCIKVGEYRVAIDHPQVTEDELTAGLIEKKRVEKQAAIADLKNKLRELEGDV